MGVRIIAGYKAFRIDEKGRLRFLFHAHKGSSIVPLDEWITAKRRWGREAKGRKYRVAFHFLRLVEKVRYEGSRA
jgi:hypothetical protein